MGIELKKVPTWRSGICDSIHFYNIGNWSASYANLYIGYKKNLESEDVPKEFTIHLTPEDQLSGIVTESGSYQKGPSI